MNFSLLHLDFNELHKTLCRSHEFAQRKIYYFLFIFWVKYLNEAFNYVTSDWPRFRHRMSWHTENCLKKTNVTTFEYQSCLLCVFGAHPIGNHFKKVVGFQETSVSIETGFAPRRWMHLSSSSCLLVFLSVYLVRN